MSHIANTLWEENLQELEKTPSGEDVYEQSIKDCKRAVKNAEYMNKVSNMIENSIRKALQK